MKLGSRPIFTPRLARPSMQRSRRKQTVKLTGKEKERRSTEAGLKNAQDQAEEQRKKLHYVEI